MAAINMAIKKTMMPLFLALFFLLFLAYSCRKVSKNEKNAAKSNISSGFMLDLIEKALSLQS